MVNFTMRDVKTGLKYPSPPVLPHVPSSTVEESIKSTSIADEWFLAAAAQLDEDELTDSNNEIFETPLKLFQPPKEHSRASSRASTLSNASLFSAASLSTSASLTTLASKASAQSFIPPRWRQQSFQRPPANMAGLPPEIYDCILRQLKAVHAHPLSPSCNSCYLRDLYSLSLTSGKWTQAAGRRLYDTVYITGSDSAHHIKKKYKSKYGGRLRLLRRTLRERPVFAALVRELKVPVLPENISERERYEFMDMVASVIMACPNLEHFIGFYPTYNHSFDRLSHALATRPFLRERIWVLGANSDTKKLSLGKGNYHFLARDVLSREEEETFLQLNAWKGLDTLFLHAIPYGVFDSQLFPSLLSQLPSLRNLSISNFNHQDFTDSSLRTLPALDSLRLESLHGLTENGISRLAYSTCSFTLTRLSLINLEIQSLSVLSRLLSSLPKLRHLTFSQETSAFLPPDELAFQPVVGSSSLKYLHWDCLIPGPPGRCGTEMLAESILAGGFPSLRVLRAPSDHNGKLQSVCKPMEQVALPSDKFSFAQVQKDGANKTLYIRNLYAARNAAQKRLDAARSEARFNIIVWDEDVFVSKHSIGFMGDSRSSVLYSLTPDVDGSDEAMLDMASLLDSSVENSPRDGCKR